MSGGMSVMDVRLPESADDAVTQRWMAWSTSHPDVSDPPAVYRAGLLAGVKLAMRAGSDIGNAVPSIVLLIDLLNEARRIGGQAMSFGHTPNLGWGAGFESMNQPESQPQPRQRTVGRNVLLESIQEREWMEQVITWVERAGWHVYHTHDSRRSNAGFPDLFLVRDERAIAIELKAVRGRLSPAQKDWGAWLQAAGIAWFVCRPTDEAMLRRVLA